MPAVAQITIQVNEKGAVSALNNLSGASLNIEPALKKAGERGNVVLTQLEGQSKKSTQAMQLLANVTGIQLPRALEQILSKTPGVSTALNAAFAATVVISLGKEILSVIDNLVGYSEQLAKVQQQSQAIITSVQNANTVLLGPQTTKQLLDQVTNSQKKINEFNKELGLTGDFYSDIVTRGLAKYNAAEANLLDQLDHELELNNKLHEAYAQKIEQQKTQDVISILEAENAKREAGLQGIEALKTAEKDRVNEMITAGKLLGENPDVTGARVAALRAQYLAQTIQYQRAEDDQTRQLAAQVVLSRVKGIDAINEAEKDSLIELETIFKRKQISEDTYNQRRLATTLIAANKRAEIERQALEQTISAEEDAAVAVSAPWDRANVQIRVDAERRIRAIQQALQDSTISEQQAAIQISAVWQETFAKMRDNLADQLESLFDDITSGNIGKRFLENFKKLIFQMTASWLLGLRQMQGSSQSSFGGGGFLGTLLGGIFGIGGGGGGGGIGIPGAGGTPPFFPTGDSGGIFGGGTSGLGGILGGLGIGGGASASSAGGGAGALLSGVGGLGLSSLGLSSGVGAGSGSVLPAGASAAIGLGGRGLANLAGLQALGGISLIGLSGKAGPIGGAALGALGGALTTSSLIALFPALLGILGPATLGIGAAIGALIGLFSGLFGSRKRQRAVEQLGQQIKDNIKSVETSYNTHQLDIDPAISQLESLRSDAQQKMHSLGGDTRTRVQQPIDDAEKRIRSTEAERQRRLAVNFGPAEFHTGGLVTAGGPAIPGRPTFHAGGEINANLLIGEGVVNHRGMSLLGPSGLDRLNSGSGVGGDLHIHVHALDGQTTAYWLRNGGTKEIWSALQRAGAEGLRA